MNEIQPKHLTLAELLVRRLFSIPDYQRAYSWTSRERKDLFDDVKKVFSGPPDTFHFMATIVCLRKESIRLGTDRYHRLDVVDGQQRLTTLIILLNSIKLALNKEKRKQKNAFQDLRDLLIKTDGDRLLLLQTNHDTSQYFSDFLRDGSRPSPDSAKTLADRELLRAISDCRAFIDDWIGSGKKLVDLISCLKNQLSFVLHEVSNERLVYSVFEVLNSRGIEVSWLDRLKSILMGTAFELENVDRDQLIFDLHQIWKDIYGKIGLEQSLSSEALRFAATLYLSEVPSRPLSERDAVDILRSSACDAASIREVARWVLRVTEVCVEIISNRRQNAVTRIVQARLLAVAIRMNSRLTIAQKGSLLAAWEKVTFRIYGMMGYDARTRIGDFVRLAWKVAREMLLAEDISDELRRIGEHSPIDDAVRALKNENCYEGWQEELRYFMFRYEEHLAREKGQRFNNRQWERIWEANSSDTIEHILPQSVAGEEIKHTLGNLMLLPPSANSGLRDKLPREKLETYRATGLLLAVEVASTKRWSEASVKRREKTLLEWATREWAD